MKKRDGSQTARRADTEAAGSPVARDGSSANVAHGADGAAPSRGGKEKSELLQKETKGKKSAGAGLGRRGVVGKVRIWVAAWVLAVNWEVVRWYGARLGDGGDEPWGLLALVAALGFLPRAVWRAGISDTRILLSAGLAVVAALSGVFLPMLVRAMFVAVALGTVVTGGGGRVARLGLLVLSLPVMATAQFYAGYPLRVVTAELGRPLLWLAGVATERRGVLLSWSGGEVIVDAPCSGVRMLWMGAVLGCVLAAWRRLRAGRTVLLIAAALAGVLGANALRAAALFLTESGVWPDAAWVHEGAGAVAFGGVAVGLWVLAARWARGRERSEGGAKEGNDVAARNAPGELRGSEARARSLGRWRRWIAAGAGVAVVASGWWFDRGRAEMVSGGRLAGARRYERVEVAWPEMFEGDVLRPVGAPERLGAFAGGFAGETRVFEQRRRVVVLRWLRAASRTVHPAADCFRARGYRVEEGGLVKDEAGGRWSEFVARRGDEVWRVRERWRDERGNVWTDVSAWWWAAQGAEAHGPWWAEVVMVRETARSVASRRGQVARG